METVPPNCLRMQVSVSAMTVTPMKKIPGKYSGIVFTFYATALMAFIMSAFLVAFNTGVDSGWPLRTLRAYALAWPLAFVSLLSIRPLVLKLVAWSTEA